MRKIERLLLTACGYSIFILTMFYVFAVLTNFTSPAIIPSQFALILLFGFIIALAEFLYNILKLKQALRCFIHYGILLLAFCIIFIISGNIASKPSAVFVAVIIFTMLYFTTWGTVKLVRKTVTKADDYLDRKETSKSPIRKNEYKSLYRED